MPRHPQTGDRAPGIDLPSTRGRFDLYERLADGPVLVVFYPRDRTLVCTRQLCNYRDHLSMFDEMGVQLVAINNDSMESHLAFAEKYKFGFPLVTDADGDTCRAYGALQELWKLRRVMLLIGRDGRVHWRRSEFRAFHRKAQELREIISGLDLHREDGAGSD